LLPCAWFWEGPLLRPKQPDDRPFPAFQTETEDRPAKCLPLTNLFIACTNPFYT
jgi:hypothetical protein